MTPVGKVRRSVCVVTYRGMFSSLSECYVESLGQSTTGGLTHRPPRTFIDLKFRNTKSIFLGPRSCAM